MKEFKIKDCKVDVGHRGLNPGGQHVGVSMTVRIKHLPSGLMAECDQCKSQFQNRQICLAMIKHGLSNLYEF